MLGVTWWGLTAAVLIGIMYDMNRKRSNTGKVYALLMVSGVVGLLIFTGQYNKFHESVLKPFFAGTFGSESVNLRYGIMFDAGSTGSRIHAFKFKIVSEEKPLVFEDEYFEQLKPGLSSYANDPVAAAKSLEPLLENAKLYIPAKYWDSTPIALKATAGLRLLPGDQADAILREVKTLFGKYPFKVSDKSVSIMDGTEEGLYSWFTVNYYIGALDNPPSSNPVMDLGGGSTQITFIPSDPGTMKNTPKGFKSVVDVFSEKYSVYTHSYLGLGLMSGRFQTMGGKEGSAETNPSTLSSACFPSGFETKWTHGGKEYTIKGTDTTGSRAEACQAAVKPVFQGVDQPAEIKYRQFTVISYYFDRAQEAGLVTSVEGGTVTVQGYADAATKACQVTNLNKDNEFQCIDLCYITSLLRDGFGFPVGTQLNVKKRIHGHEISWALGAMFQMMPGGRAAKKAPGSESAHPRKQDGKQTVTLLAGHSFIKWLERHLNKKHRGKKTSRVLNVSSITETKLTGFPGENTFGFLHNRMENLPRASIVVLDIGCNDIDSREDYSDPKVAASYAAQIVKTFITKYNVKYVIACKATVRTPKYRHRFVPVKEYNKNIKLFNIHLEEEISKIERASVHEHSEMLSLSDSEWTDDGLHPAGLGMVRYIQSMRRAIIKAHKLASKYY